MLIDLTGDTVVPERLLAGYTAVNKAGVLITGTMIIQNPSIDVPTQPSNPASPVNKVIYNGNAILDLTGVTVTKEVLAKGIVAHDKSGKKIIGALEGVIPAFEFEWSNESLTENTIEFSELIE